MSTSWTRSSGRRIRRDRVATLGEVPQERIPYRRRGLGVFDRPSARPTLRLRLQRGRVAQTEHRLDRAEARRLEPRRGVEPIAEGEELEGRHRLEHVDLRDQRLEDLQDAVEQVERSVGVAFLEGQLHALQLVAQLLEPQLIDLVDDDEQQLVMLGAVRAGGAFDL